MFDYEDYHKTPYCHFCKKTINLENEDSWQQIGFEMYKCCNCREKTLTKEENANVKKRDFNHTAW